MKRVVRIHRQGKVRTVRRRALTALPAVDDPDSLITLIQALIPLGLQAVYKTLEDEVTALAGERYRRTGGQPGVVRWGAQQGSVYLVDQKLPITYPRVRDRLRN